MLMSVWVAAATWYRLEYFFQFTEPIMFIYFTRALYFFHRYASKAALLLGTLLVFAVVSSAQADSGVLRLTEAEAVMQGEVVQLPHQWTHDPAGMLGVVHYRLTFPKPTQSDALQAVYLSHINMAVKVQLNGQVIGDSGFDSQPMGRYFHTPILYSFSSNLYVEGNNTLEIDVKAYANRFGALSPVSIGEYSKLEPIFARDYFENHTLQVISTALSAIFVLLLVPVWWMRRKSMFAWFIGGSAAWSVSSLNVFLHDVPLPAALWEWIIHISVGLIPLCYGLFIFRLSDLSYPKLERFMLLASGVFIAFSTLFAGTAQFFFLTSLWHASLLLFGAFAIYRLFRFLVSKRDFSVFYIASALLLVCVLAVHDLVIQQLTAQQNGFWLNYAAPLLLTAMGLLMVRQFVTAVQTAESLNVSLESRVAAAQTALGASYAELRVLEMNRAAQDERERIYRNLHDDVGAKLLGLVISAQRSNQTREADLARSALQDLRDVVSRSSTSSILLADLIADWRAETNQRISTAQLKLQWNSSGLEDSTLMVNPEAALNLSRILREAISNVLRHANAACITLSVRIEADMLCLDIADDGRGLAENFKEHRGMESMRTRAEALKGSLHLEALAPQGIALHLKVPVPYLAAVDLPLPPPLKDRK